MCLSYITKQYDKPTCLIRAFKIFRHNKRGLFSLCQGDSHKSYPLHKKLCQADYLSPITVEHLKVLNADSGTQYPSGFHAFRYYNSAKEQLSSYQGRFNYTVERPVICEISMSVVTVGYQSDVIRHWIEYMCLVGPEMFINRIIDLT